MINILFMSSDDHITQDETNGNSNIVNCPEDSNPKESNAASTSCPVSSDLPCEWKI